jgi:hypothetical protein
MIETFITVHNQDIVLKNEEFQKYSNLTKYRYVFVGNNDTSKITNLNNVIFAKNYEDNIEHLHYFLDFTSWYLIIKNNLIETDLVSLIQYDTDITPSFESETIKNLNSDLNLIVGYVPYSILSCDFLDCCNGTELLSNSLMNVYNLKVYDVVNEYVVKTSDTLWPSSNNIATTKSTLEKFINWFEPIVYDMGNFKYSSHAFERAIKIFSIVNNIDNSYVNDVLIHYQLDSHKTQRG